MPRKFRITMVPGFHRCMKMVATANAGAHSTCSACTSLERHCVASQTSPCGSVLTHFASDVHASVRVSGQQVRCRTLGRKSGKENLEFRFPCSSEDVRHSSGRCQHRSGKCFPHFARSAKTNAITPLFSTPTPKQAGNTCATCRGVVDQAFADPTVHICMTGK